MREDATFAKHATSIAKQMKASGDKTGYRDFRKLSRVHKKALVKYLAGIYAGTESVDLVKDAIEALVTGEELTAEQITADAAGNMLRLTGVGGWQLSQIVKGDLTGAISDLVAPPVLSFFENIIHDARSFDKILEGEKSSKVLKNLPYAGRLVSPVVQGIAK